VWADVTGGAFSQVTRAAAVGIPAVARQRHLVCGTIAGIPLHYLVGDTVQATPEWVVRTDGELSPYHRMLWTLDDLLFYGWSLWRTDRRGRGVQAPIEYATRVAYERWDTDQAGRIEVDGELVDADRYIAIPGPHEGIVNFGAESIRRALDNAQAASTAARNPSAYLELHYTGDEPMTPDAITELVAGWAAARRGENGGVAFTSKSLEVKEHGTHESHLLIEGRNADAVDMSRLVSSPAAMADATTAGASLTYETTEGRNAQFIDYGLALYMNAVTARLSMDDCVPRGGRLAFDTTAIRTPLAPPTGPTLED
jgi:hypothetical protein